MLCSLLFAGPHPAPAQDPGAQIQVSINPRQRFQMIDGFGVNFNGTYFRDAQKPMIDLLIDDLGATIFRLDPYGLLDWEVVNDDKDPNVMNWEYYNDRYSIPTFEASLGGGALPKFPRHPAVSDPQRNRSRLDAG